MQLSSYTLLIVESGVTARAIESCEIPGLEVLPTSGYAWYPEQDAKTGKLKARANPDQRDFRNALKTKAQFASRIILATDSDPSGEFIAHSVYRFLKKDKRIYSGNLGSISPVGIHLLLDSAEPVEDQKSTSLERYFRSRIMLADAVRGIFQNRFSFEEIVALGCLLTQKEFTDFMGENQSHHFKSFSPVFPSEDRRIITKIVQSDELIKGDVLYPSIKHPVSTAFLPASASGSYAKSQEALNRLFSFYDAELGSGLISYPRTVATGYYDETWNRLTTQLQQRAGAESVLTPSLRRVVSADESHEALHVVNTALEPHDLRPYLKRDLLDLYRELYRHTVSSLKHPAGIPAEQTLKSKAGNMFYTYDGSVPLGSAVLIPVTTLSEFMQMMLDTGWVKASRLGNTMDQLCRSELFSVMNKPVGHITINTQLNTNNTERFALKLRSASEQLRNALKKNHAEFEADFKAVQQELTTSQKL